MYLAESLFADVKGLRQDMGDEGFFQKLNHNKAHGGGWDAIVAGWEAAGFDAALDRQEADRNQFPLSFTN